VKVQLVSTTQTKLRLLSRLIVAVALVLALLSGIAPLSSASAGHLCAMECCAGLPPHAAGSCHMGLSSPGETKELQHDQAEHCGLAEADTGAIKGISAGVMGMKTSAVPTLDLDSVTIDASEHCAKNSQAEEAGPATTDSPRLPSVNAQSFSAQSFSKPCPPECGTGALSSGVRPARQAAALAYNVRPRPPTAAGKFYFSRQNFSIDSAYRKQVRPRGPPLSFS
jgi:hypothetical protein